MGECPQYLLEAFGHWALDGTPNVALVDDGQTRRDLPWRELCTQLRRCDESMPGDLCDWFGMPAGATYGVVARRLLGDGDARASRTLRGVDAEGFVCGWSGAEWVRLYPAS
jgi:hypothetical protein